MLTTEYVATKEKLNERKAFLRTLKFRIEQTQLRMQHLLECEETVERQVLDLEEEVCKLRAEHVPIMARIQHLGKRFGL